MHSYIMDTKYKYAKHHLLTSHFVIRGLHCLHYVLYIS